MGKIRVEHNPTQVASIEAFMDLTEYRFEGFQWPSFGYAIMPNGDFLEYQVVIDYGYADLDIVSFWQLTEEEVSEALAIVGGVRLWPERLLDWVDFTKSLGTVMKDHLHDKIQPFSNGGRLDIKEFCRNCLIDLVEKREMLASEEIGFLRVTHGWEDSFLERLDEELVKALTSTLADGQEIRDLIIGLYRHQQNLRNQSFSQLCPDDARARMRKEEEFIAERIAKEEGELYRLRSDASKQIRRKL